MNRCVAFVVLFQTLALGQDSSHLRIVSHGLRERKEIALTFDACPAGKQKDYDSLITKLLVEQKIPATLFLSGHWIKSHPNETKFLASFDHFDIGNHSYSHPHLQILPDEKIKLEIKRTQDLLFKITGKKAVLFRPPFGEYDSRVAQIVAGSGLQLVEYDLPSGDPDTTVSTRRLISHVVKNAKGGSIIVMHINGRGRHTAEALPKIIAQLKAKGFTLVKVSKFLSN
ncbi:MAG TPA: polysaccharide deacetylase family protein [Bacteroidota bacterium]|nr:polysaccharide deacetylase family protein [Bacteroidota bacterium]